VNERPDDVEIAEAAWRILASTGGLMDRSDIRRRFGHRRQRTFELTNQRYFPDPVGSIGERPVWLAAHVERYHASPPRSGRPPKTEGTDA
jgi:hypothetical protein